MKQYAKILTSTPIKYILIEEKNKKAAKGKDKVKSTNHEPQIKVAHKVEGSVLQEQNTSSESDISFN